MVTFIDSIIVTLYTLLALLVFCTQSVEAFDGGDATALILGLMIGILGICACLGVYARKRSGQWNGVVH